jgi:hypothetical protein
VEGAWEGAVEVAEARAEVRVEEVWAGPVTAEVGTMGQAMVMGE